MKNLLARVRALPVFAVFIAVLALCAPAFALLVQPIVIRMQSSGSAANAALTVVNDRNRPNTVEIKINKLVLPEKGPLQLVPDDGKNFLVFPPIATIQPGKTQVFRIRWVGDPALAEAQSYMFTSAEVPIDQPGQSGVQVVYAIQSLLTVSSPKLTSDVAVVASERTTHDYPASERLPARTEQGLAVTFINSGADVAFISDYSMHAEIPGSKWKLDVDSSGIQQYVGLGLVPPHARRQLFLPIADVPPTGDVQFTFKRGAKR